LSSRHHTTKTRTPVSLLMQPAVSAEVRLKAEAEETSVSTILRRLIKRGLELERSTDSDEAA
jgi:hypothetical protein